MKKIIDRNGRLFGFISVIDLLVIVVVAVMGFALYTKNTQMAITSTNTADQTITYQILASGIRTYVAEAVREGDQLFDPDRSSGGTLGTITDIQEGAVNGIVKIDIGGGNVVSSTISRNAIKELGLAVGKEAYAVIKATSVMIGIDD